MQNKREKVENFFKAIKRESSNFCSEHAIKPEIKDRRSTRKKRAANDSSDDERIVRAFKIEVVICGLNVILEQIKDKFTDQDMAFLREIRLFCPADGLASSKSSTPKDVL